MARSFDAGGIGNVIMLVAGLGMAVISLVFIGVLTGSSYELIEADLDALTTNVINESVTVVWNHAVQMANPNLDNTSISVLNGSQVVGVGNFTFNYHTGTVTLLGSATQYSKAYNQTIQWNNTALNFTYVYGNPDVEESVKAGIVSGFEAYEQTGNYLPVIVLAFIVAFVLAIILGSGLLGGFTGGNGGAL